MEKDKFQPIVMPCTKEQYESLIPVLEKNNIIYNKYQGVFNGIVNNFNSYNYCVGKITNFNNTELHTLRNRKYYQRFNRKIFLKSLGIVEEPEFVLPEKWYIEISHNYDNIVTLGITYFKNIIEWGVMKTDKYMFCDIKNQCCDSSNNLPKGNGFKKITFEQFQKYVLKEEFVLPEKWCVQITKENAYILNEYLIRHLHKYKHSTKGWCISIDRMDFNDKQYFHSETFGTNQSKYCHSANIKCRIFTEITFEQFQEYVLNQDISISESQSVTNKQPKMKSTVNEIKQYEPTIKKGLLVVTQERIGIVTKYISDNNFDVTILHPSTHHGLIVTNLNYANIRIFKGKLTLEQ